jgi:hypothetical protein
LNKLHTRNFIRKAISLRELLSARKGSRIGFVHELKSINKDEMKFLFEQKWQELGRQFDKIPL